MLQPSNKVEGGVHQPRCAPQLPTHPAAKISLVVFAILFIGAGLAAFLAGHHILPHVFSTLRNRIIACALLGGVGLSFGGIAVAALYQKNTMKRQKEEKRNVVKENEKASLKADSSSIVPPNSPSVKPAPSIAQSNSHPSSQTAESVDVAKKNFSKKIETCLRKEGQCSAAEFSDIKLNIRSLFRAFISEDKEEGVKET